MPSKSSIAIVGGGLSGLSLALALSQQATEGEPLAITIYEALPDAPLDIGGAFMLSPNALRVLDRLGVYKRLVGAGQAYKFSTLDYCAATSPDVVTEVQEFGSEEKYGYPALRVYRKFMISLLLEMVADTPGVEYKLGKKFSRVLEETPSGVRWEFEDGEEAEAFLLIGADGIHSKVRRHMYPDLSPAFTGMAAVTTTVPTAQLRAQPHVTFPLTYTSTTHGAVVLAPQLIDGSEMFIGKQLRVRTNPEPTRDEWRAIFADKQELIRFLQADNDAFPDLVTNGLSHIEERSLNVWPFYVVPKLRSWVSDGAARVVLVGDAAHAIPPSAGQGVNQAFEDVYMFAGAVAAAKRIRAAAAAANPAASPAAVMSDALRFWQSWRQDRVDKVLHLNAQIDLRRLPQQHGQIEREEIELSWLYNVDYDAAVAQWEQEKLAEQTATAAA